MINVKSFYLSTLTSHLFRNTFLNALRKLLHIRSQRLIVSRNTLFMSATKPRRLNETQN